MSLKEDLSWRYATKKFDPSKKVSNEDLEYIKDAIQLSASSYGLQLYKVLIITDQEIKKKLQPASWGQSQIVDASHVFVFCHYADVKDEHVDEFVSLKAAKLDITKEELKGYGDFIKQKMSERSLEEKQQWTAKQVYIALGNLLAAAGERKVASCPMEGFEPDKYDDILGLADKGLKAAVVAAVGYRSEEDETQHAPKVRKDKSQIFEAI